MLDVSPVMKPFIFISVNTSNKKDWSCVNMIIFKSVRYHHDLIYMELDLTFLFMYINNYYEIVFYKILKFKHYENQLKIQNIQKY